MVITTTEHITKFASQVGDALITRSSGAMYHVKSLFTKKQSIASKKGTKTVVKLKAILKAGRNK